MGSSDESFHINLLPSMLDFCFASLFQMFQMWHGLDPYLLWIIVRSEMDKSSLVKDSEWCGFLNKIRMLFGESIWYRLGSKGTLDNPIVS